MKARLGQVARVAAAKVADWGAQDRAVDSTEGRSGGSISAHETLLASLYPLHCSS